VIDSLLQDIRYAARRLRGAPGFAIAVVSTLAIGIGGAAATFSVVDASVLRPLPFPEPDRLVRLRDVTPRGDPFSLSLPDYRDFAQRLRTVSSLGAMKPLQVTLTGAGAAARLEAAAVTSTIFPVLGIRAEHGRLFSDAEDRDRQPAASIILGHAIWRQRFGADPGVVGRAVTIDGRRVIVIGVLPATATFPPADVIVPLGANLTDRTDKWLDVIGRMAHGATLDAVRAEAQSVASALSDEHVERVGWTVRVEPLADWLVGPGLRRMVWVLLGAVAALLALACANIAGLLMTRAVSRRAEMGVRAALGAKRGRLVRQLVTENLLLGLIGGGLGLLAGSWIVSGLSSLLADLLPLGRVPRIDARAIGATFTIMLASTIGFGLVPSFHTAGSDLVAALRAHGRTATPAGRRWAAVLVVVQIALAMLLVVGSFLLMGSFLRLSSVDTGFQAENVLTVPLSLPEPRYPEQARPAFFETAIARLSAVSGVESAAATATNPFRQFGYANDVTPEDRASSAPPSGLLQAGWRSVTPGFFATLGVPLLEGRTFTDADRDGAPRVVVISRTLADRLWPEGGAVGRRLYWGGVGGRTRTVVGVVGDIRDVRLDAPLTPMLYLAYGQLPLADMTVLLRTRRGSPGIAEAIRRELTAIDASLPVTEVRPLDANRAAATSAPRFRTVMLAAFAAVALLLAAVGLYGVVAFTVAQRTREIAIRAALGARPGQLTELFFRRGLTLTLAGTAAGLFLAWAASGVLQTLLFETDSHEPRVFALAAAVLVGVTLLASYLPARRAADLDPRIGLSRE
jgi:putative ABC transport system permease protein